MGHIADTLSRYTHGEITLDEAAGELGSMHEFPPVASPPVTDLLGGSDDAYGPDAEDDGHELTAARSSGAITPAAYATLYTAYSGARRAAR